MSHILIAISVGFILLVGAHIGLWRRRPSPAPRLKTLVILAILSVLCSVGMLYGFGEATPVNMSVVLWVETFLITVYIQVYAVVIRSVSLTLLSRLLQSKDSVDFDVLCQEYQSSSRFDDRVQILCESGLLAMNGNTVTLTRKGAALARLACELGKWFTDRMEG